MGRQVDELTRAFQALRFTDDPGTPNGILMGAAWAVAVAFGQRVTAADRDLVLERMAAAKPRLCR